jgi:D-glycero-alpha-D-manno-heptose 1-phosphate guanylyltransferase
MDSSYMDAKAVLLVGGMGTRLRSVVAKTPKPLASVGDQPFLELLVRQLRYQGISRLVLCTGYLAQEIENNFGDGRARDLTIEYSKESHPLGTAGAVKLAQPLLQGVTDFLVMNGDSFMEIDFRELLHFHRRTGGIASMAVVRMKNEMRYGTVQLAADGRVSGFSEKSDADSSGFVNAGIYVFNQSIFEHLPEGPASLEREVFPKILNLGLYASEQRGIFIDIGIPEDYARAQALCEQLYEAACRKQSPTDTD